MNRLARLDHRFCWHPFTQMRDWLKHEPVVIVSGHGAVLRDARGREFLDANSSIWTNLHGHRHPRLDAALRRQLGKIAHSSALGLANKPASELAEQLVRAANPRSLGHVGAGTLRKVFYSDDGSTALEVALKLAYEYGRRTGRTPYPRFLSLQGAYHGDTIGAVSVGHIDLFHRAYRGLLFRSDTVMSPYCYRCPHNRSKPERADARDYRACRWECLDRLDRILERRRRRGQAYTAMVVEPLVQGAAGMIPQPRGWLSQVAARVRAHRALLIADEVLTGFGRTGLGLRRELDLFACHQEGVQPDLMALAKGMTGGYLPLAATLTSRAVFDVFLGEYHEFKTFFHGHSFTANQLGCATALASLDLLREPSAREHRRELERAMTELLRELWVFEHVGDIRQVGLIAGIELVKDWRRRTTFDLRERAGMRVAEAMARRGVITRPIGNVLVLMPPYVTTLRQLRRMIETMAEAIAEVFPSR